MKKYILIILLIACCFSSAYSQKIEKDSSKQNDTINEKKVDFNVMPFLSYNRNLEFMFGAMPMLMYKLDKDDDVSSKSLTGLSAIYTTNGSYLLSFFNKWFFKEDNWRATFFVFSGDFNSQFYMNDIETPDFYDYGTKATIIRAGIQRRIINKLYGGISYTFANYDSEFEDDVQPATSTQTNGIELSALYDSRNAIYYPTSGAFTQLQFNSFPEWFGNDAQANKISAEYNTYYSTRNNTDVIAARFSGRMGLGDIVFEQQETIGGKDIRGYSEGKYRGDGRISLQGEYRYNFGEKMGLVGFAGLATIYGSENEEFDWKAYPGVGVGYRYAAFKKVKFNIGLDAAVGKDDWSINFRIGEAF